MERSALLESISRKLETPLVDLETRLDSFMQDVDRLRKQVEVLERENLRREAQELLPGVQDVDGTKVLAAKTSASSVEAMREMGDWLKDRLDSAVIVLAAVQSNRPTIVAMVTPDLVAKGLHAGNIARETARVMGGGGGGRPEMAQAGGKRADKLDEALSTCTGAGEKGGEALRFLCLDVGERRIGLAISDPGGLLATPVGFFERTRLRRDVANVVECALERKATAILVGIPLSLNGKVGPQAKRVEGFLRSLRAGTELPVHTTDERYSTAEAERLLRQAGRQPSRHKGEVDAAAATVILQGYLDQLRVQNPP